MTEDSPLFYGCGSLCWLNAILFMTDHMRQRITPCLMGVEVYFGTVIYLSKFT